MSIGVGYVSIMFLKCHIGVFLSKNSGVISCLSRAFVLYQGLPPCLRPTYSKMYNYEDQQSSTSFEENINL